MDGYGGRPACDWLHALKKSVHLQTCLSRPPGLRARHNLWTGVSCHGFVCLCVTCRDPPAAVVVYLDFMVSSLLPMLCRCRKTQHGTVTYRTSNTRLVARCSARYQMMATCLKYFLAGFVALRFMFKSHLCQLVFSRALCSYEVGHQNPPF